MISTAALLEAEYKVESCVESMHRPFSLAYIN